MDQVALVLTTVLSPQFPKGIDELTDKGSLGGSTGARLVENPETGKQYVMKCGNSVGHILEEAATDSVYQALGVNVPAHRIYQTSSDPVKLSEYLPGMREIGELLCSERAAVHTQLQKHFAVDALLANWDVIGTAEDNILVGEDGTVYRVDNGSGMRYRAQGAKKHAFLASDAGELTSMLDYNLNYAAAQVFGSMSQGELSRIKSALDKSSLHAAEKENLKRTLEGRVTVFVQAVQNY